jgi:hypothetical protein
MVLNPKHVGEGRVRFILKSGERLDAIVGCNDPHGEVFWLLGDGFYWAVAVRPGCRRVDPAKATLMTRRMKTDHLSDAIREAAEQQPIVLRDPVIVMYREGGALVCRIHPAKDDTHKHYGLMICDLVRHVANAFKVDEADVWEWVDKERRNPTTKITNPS